MDETERHQLAQRLSALSLKAARKEIRRLDPDANMRFWRNAIGDEYHTLFACPNEGLHIILVEKGDVEPLDAPDTVDPRGRKRRQTTFRYLEARVEVLDHPAKK